MNYFYLVRHGQKQDLIGNPPLTDFGRNQAEITGNFFIDKNIDHIFASPLIRTTQTATIISEKIKLPIEFDPRIKERFNWGDIPNQNFEEFLDLWIQSTNDRNLKFDNCRSSFQAGLDFETFLHELTQKYSDKNFLIVTHGGIIIDLLRNLFSLDYLEKIPSLNPIVVDGEIKEVIHECSITLLTENNGKYESKYVNNFDHLEN